MVIVITLFLVTREISGRCPPARLIAHPRFGERGVIPAASWIVVYTYLFFFLLKKMATHKHTLHPHIEEEVVDV